MSVLRLDSASYTYPPDGFTLRNVSFGLHGGECVALSGHNGSGKTTLGKLCSGLLRPQSGSLTIDGEDTSDWTLGKIGASVGYLYQDPSRQLFAPNAMENLTFPAELRGELDDEVRSRANALLKQFELLHVGEQGIFTLSRGERQRLALCALLMEKPRYLVLDEPDNALDARRRGILCEHIKRLEDSGLGVLIISHDSELVDMLGARRLRIERGRLCE